MLGMLRGFLLLLGGNSDWHSTLEPAARCRLRPTSHIPHMLSASMKLLVFHTAVGFNPLRVLCPLCSPSRVIGGWEVVPAPLLLLPCAVSCCFLVVFWRQLVFGVWLCLYHSEAALPGEPALPQGALRESKTV